MRFFGRSGAVVLSVLTLVQSFVGSPFPVAAQPVPSVMATPVSTPLPVQAGAEPLGAPSVASMPPSGGQVALGDGSVTVQAYSDPSRPDLLLTYQAVDARTLPGAQNGLSLGFAAFQLNALNVDSQTPVNRFGVPVDVVIRPSGSDLALAQGNVRRLQLGSWSGDNWVAVPCSQEPTSGMALVCSTTQPGLFVPLVVLPTNPVLNQLDFAVADGRFYTQSNGFGGGGGLGYSVLDDGTAPLWSEFQRQGGVNRLGYPVTNRFLYAGLVTQAFQYGALQWAPELGQSILLNIMDELHAHGSDSWLDTRRQIPPAPAGGQVADASILAPFPAMLALYEGDPDLYGEPVSVKDYGELASARFQRSSMQVWNQDQPFAPAGAAISVSGGDVAKAAGLWPASATKPGGPPAN